MAGKGERWEMRIKPKRFRLRVEISQTRRPSVSIKINIKEASGEERDVDGRLRRRDVAKRTPSLRKAAERDECGADFCRWARRRRITLYGRFAQKSGEEGRCDAETRRQPVLHFLTSPSLSLSLHLFAGSSTTYPHVT